MEHSTTQATQATPLALPNCHSATSEWDDQMGEYISLQQGDDEYVIRRLKKTEYLVSKLPFANDPSHYHIRELPSGYLKCNCPAQVKCKHVKWLEWLLQHGYLKLMS